MREAPDEPPVRIVTGSLPGTVIVTEDSEPNGSQHSVDRLGEWEVRRTPEHTRETYRGRIALTALLTWAALLVVFAVRFAVGGSEGAIDQFDSMFSVVTPVVAGIVGFYFGAESR